MHSKLGKGSLNIFHENISFILLDIYTSLKISPLRRAGKLLLVYVHQLVLGGPLQGICPFAR
jgi:uncharacterized membrane protein